MSNIIQANNSQMPEIERITFDNSYAIPTEKGLAVAAEVIEDLGQRLVATVERKLSGNAPFGVEQIEEIEKIIQSATKAPLWAQEKALKRVQKWLAQQPTGDLSLKGRVAEFGNQLKFIQMASKAIEQAYSGMEDLAEQALKLKAGSGEIYLDHLIAMASTLPTLSKAMAIEGNFDRNWALRDLKHIQWGIEDQGRDLIKAIRPEIQRAKKEYADSQDQDLRTHLRLIGRMKTQVKKLYWVADRLDGPLKGVAEELRWQAKEIEGALEELGEFPTGAVSQDKERRKAFFQGRIDQKKYKKLTGEDGEQKGTWAAWLFLGLQVLTMLQGAGSVLLGHETAALKAQAEQMQKEVFSKIDPSLKSEYEKDGSRLGAILSDKWNVLKQSKAGSMDDSLLRKLSPEAKEAVQKMLTNFDHAPSSEQIQKVCDAVVQTRMAKQIPSPYHHMSIGDWLEVFFKAEKEQPAQANAVSRTALDVFQENNLVHYLDAQGPPVDSGLVLHLAGREFGKASGLESYQSVAMLSYVKDQLRLRNDPRLQVAADKIEQGITRTEDFEKLDNNQFSKRLNFELSQLAVGDNLIWSGGWTSPGMMGGHAVIYEIVKMGDDDFTFRIYNMGDGVQYHPSTNMGDKMQVLGMHEIVEVRRANLIRPVVIQGLQEMKNEPKDGVKWDPSEMYYNLFGRMEGKISKRLIPAEHLLPSIFVGICTYSSLSAWLHHQLGSDQLHDRVMVELEAKATWDYWQANRETLDNTNRELLVRAAKQTIQDAIRVAQPERNSLNDRELELISSRMEEIIQGAKRNREIDVSPYLVKIDSKISDLVFTGAKVDFAASSTGRGIEPAPPYQGLEISPFEGAKSVKEAVKKIHQGNIANNWQQVRAATHSFVQSMPLDQILATEKMGSPFAKSISPAEAVSFVDDLVQLASEFQWSLQWVLHKDPSRMFRLPIKDAMVPIKLLTIADSIARQFEGSTGIALPNMLQQQMAVVLYGITAYSRVDNPALEDDMAKLRAYWDKVDPSGKERGKEITQPLADWEKFASLFGFEWAPTGLYYYNSDVKIHISEDVELAERKVKYVPQAFGKWQEWPLIAWTVQYLRDHPEKLKELHSQLPLLQKASPTAVALAALMDQLRAEEDRRFPDPNNPLSKMEMNHSGRVQGVLPEIFFHLWDLSFITNYLFTGGWNSADHWSYLQQKQSYNLDKDADFMLRQRPIRSVDRYVEQTDEGPHYFWELHFEQYGHPAGDRAQRHRSIWRSTGPDVVLPGPILTGAYGEHDESLSNVYGKIERVERDWGGSLYRYRQPPKDRALLEHKDAESRYDQSWIHSHWWPQFQRVHTLKESREMAQRLLGLSSKEQLQIEETLAFFTTNFPLLEKSEYIKMLHYMLFEQGFLLEEIQSRNPKELAALTKSIENLAIHGHQYFGELMGKYEIAASFLDIAAKARRYLSHAGQNQDLIEDPIPKLRKSLQDSGLTDRERTYLQYILAKSSQDPLDIVTLGIQQNLYPFEFTPFDDEIRRDLPIEHRVAIRALFMGPDRNRHLNTILQNVLPHHKAQEWKVHGDFPLFQTTDGRITLNVLKGSYYEVGLTPRALPEEIRERLKQYQLTSNPEAIKAVQTPDGGFLFTTPEGVRMVAKNDEAFYQREIDGKFYQLQLNPLEVCYGIRALESGNLVWSNNEETRILEIGTGKEKFQIRNEKITRHDGLVLAKVAQSFNFLTKFEDPSWILAWTDPNNGKLAAIEFPRFNLSFTVDGEGKIRCDQLSGYFLHPIQRHSYLEKIENYLVLDRLDRNQNTQQVIAMPLQHFAESRSHAFDPEAVLLRDIRAPKQRYALYDVDPMDRTLIPRPIEGRFHLAMVHLWHHNYELAAELIRGYGGQHSPYTAEELKLLDKMIELNKFNHDHSPQGNAVRMIAFAARIRHHLDFGKEAKMPSENRDYSKYRHQLEFTPELALTKEEEHLIQEQLGISRSGESKNVQMQIPDGYIEKSQGRREQNWKLFFDALSGNDAREGLLRAGLNGKNFYDIYEAILRSDYQAAYRRLTGTFLSAELDAEQAYEELLTALQVVRSGRVSDATKVLAKVLIIALMEGPVQLPSRAEIIETVRKTDGGWSHQERSENEMDRSHFYHKYFSKDSPYKPQFSTVSGTTKARAPIVRREPPAQIDAREAYQHSVKLHSVPKLQGPVIADLDDYITPIPTGKISTAALQKIFQVKPVEDVVQKLQDYESQTSALPTYRLKDREGLRRCRLEIEQEHFVMTGRESTALKNILEAANRLPQDPTLKAAHQAALASGNLTPVTLLDLARALTQRQPARIQKLNPGLSAQEIDRLLQATMDLLIHATERQRKQAVIEALKDLEEANGTSPQEISNLIGQIKAASDAVRQFDPAEHPEYLVFEYYMGILLQERQVAGLDELMHRVRRGEKIHSKEVSNVLEMIMGSGKTAVLIPLIAYLEANGEQLSLIVMPEGLMPDKIQELEERFGKSFGRSIDVLTFDRDTNFEIGALKRLLTRLDEARESGKLVMVSSSSLQSLLLRFIEDVLNKNSSRQIDLFRQVLAKLRNHGSITFDELDSIADVLKLQIFSLAGPNGERIPANEELKTTTAELIKFMVTDPQLAPICTKPFTAETHHKIVKPRLLEAILTGKICPEISKLDQSLIRNYLLNKEDPEAFAYVAGLESLSLKNQLAVCKQQLNKMIPETFSKRVDEHYGLVEDHQVDEETKLISKPLEKGSWEIGSEHGTAEEGINYSLQIYLAKGLPKEFVRKEFHELRDQLLSDLAEGAIKSAEESPIFAQLMRMTGGKRYPLNRIGDKEIDEILAHINQNDPGLIIDLAMKYAIHPQLKIFPLQLQADALVLFQMAMTTRGFSGTIWNWQTFDAMFKAIQLSDTEAKTLHLLHTNSPQDVTIVSAKDLDGKLDQLFQGKSSIAIADVGNMFADDNGEEVARKILEKGPWKGVPYYDEKDNLLVALPGRPSEPLLGAGVAKEDRAPYWKQELCTGSDIPLGITASAVVTFGRYTMMRDLLQTVWRLRKLDRGQTVRFAVEEGDRAVIVETLENLTKQKIEKLELRHLLLYAAYSQALRIADDNHRSFGQQLRAQLIGQVFNVIVQPEVTSDQIIEILQATKGLFLREIDPNPYNLYGTCESLEQAKKVVEAELQEVLSSEPMIALAEHPVLAQYCDVQAIEKELRETADRMLPRMASHLYQPIDTGVRLKVKTKTRAKTKTEANTETKTKTKTQVQLRTAVHEKRPELPVDVLPWTKETLFTPDLLKPASASLVREANINNLPARQVAVADALSHYHPIASIFDPRLLTSLNRMPIYTPKDLAKQVRFVPYDEYEDPVTNHILLIEDKGEIRVMLLDQDDASQIKTLMKDRIPDAPNLGLLNLGTNKIWRHSGQPIELAHFHGLTAQAKLVNGILDYTEEERAALLEFLQGKDVKAIRQWFTQIVLGNRQRSQERFPNSDLAKVFNQAIERQQ